jgi:thiol:disulfide interchange protein DsbC
MKVMIRRLSWVLLLCGSMLGIQAVLAESTAEATIRAAIEKGVPRVRIAEISPSPITGIYRVTTEQGPVLYSTADGSHFIVGDLYRLTGAGAINVSEEGACPGARQVAE